MSASGEPLRVLVFAAHPDDEVLGMGGTIAVHAALRGDSVRIVCVTDGSSTQYPDDAKRRSQKEQEARSAAAELGVDDYVHLDLPDMRLDTLAHVEVNRVVEEQVRELAPQVVYTPSPSPRAPCPASTSGAC
jgi:N-acetylglucosamine malate deacetylase 1